MRTARPDILTVSGVSPELRETLKSLAAEQGTTASALIRDLIVRAQEGADDDDA